MTKLVFHLGDMKTGSTAIQTALSSKRWTCDSVKLIYPHANRVSHITFAQSLSGRVDGSRTERLVQEILSEIAAHPGADVAVISAEHFESVKPEVLKQTIEALMPGHLAGARFIAYVRPHADRIPSTYAERIKTGQYVGTMTELQALLHSRKTFVYTQRFMAWRKTFGDAFELRPMIRERLFRQDVVADFLQFALQTEGFTLADAPDANESVSLENLSILRQMHVKLAGGKHKGENYQSTIGRSLARRMNESNFRTGTKVRIHRDLAQLVRDEYAEDAAALDAAFFTGTPMTDALDIAVAKSAEAEQSVRIEDHFTEREQYLINTFLDQTCVLIKADPDFLAETLRVEHRGNVIAHDEAPAPKRRRPVKDRKAAGRMAGKTGAGPAGRKAGAGKARRAGLRAENRANAPKAVTDQPAVSAEPKVIPAKTGPKARKKPTARAKPTDA